MLREDIAVLGPVRLRLVEEAQARIVTVVRTLQEAEEIIITRGVEDVLVLGRARIINGPRALRERAATTERACGAAPAIIPTMTGSGPMWLFIDVLGLPTASGAGAGYPDTRAHAPNEHIRLRDFLPAVRHAIALLQAMAEYRPAA